MIAYIILITFFIILIFVAYSEIKNKRIDRILRNEVSKCICLNCGNKLNNRSLWVHQKQMLKEIEQYKSKNPSARINYFIPKCVCEICKTGFKVDLLNDKIKLILINS